MDTKFSTAIHSLILISESKIPMSSEQIAQSVGTNSSYIRKVLGLLKKNGLISSHQGKSGFYLNFEPGEITLLKIYRSVNSNLFFDIHQNPSDQCIVGRHIKTTLTSLLDSLESSIDKELSNKTLADCITLMKEDLSLEELSQYEDK